MRLISWIIKGNTLITPLTLTYNKSAMLNWWLVYLHAQTNACFFGGPRRVSSCASTHCTQRYTYVNLYDATLAMKLNFRDVIKMFIAYLLSKKVLQKKMD